MTTTKPDGWKLPKRWGSAVGILIALALALVMYRPLVSYFRSGPWCYDKPHATPPDWVCEEAELGCYKRLAQARADMRFPNGPQGKDAFSPADPYAIWCVELASRR